MRVVKYKEMIKESKEELEELLKKEKDVRIYRRNKNELLVSRSKLEWY